MKHRSIHLLGALAIIVAVLLFAGTAIAQSEQWCASGDGTATGCAEIKLNPASLVGDFYLGDRLLAQVQNPGRLILPPGSYRIDVRNIQSTDAGNGVLFVYSDASANVSIVQGKIQTVTLYPQKRFIRGTLNLTCDIRNSTANDSVACAVAIDGVGQPETVAPGAKYSYFLDPASHVVSVTVTGASAIYWSPVTVEQKITITAGQTANMKPRFDKQAHVILTLSQPGVTADFYIDGKLIASQAATANAWVAPNKNHKIEARNITDPAANGLYRWRDATTNSYLGAGVERIIQIKLVKESLPVQGLVCSGGQKYVALLVDPALVGGIRTALDQYEQDLCTAHYAVVENSAGFADAGAVRSYLSGLNTATNQKLAGAIIIGNLPHAYQWVTVAFANPNLVPISEEVISYQYYADLDGDFLASPGYASPGGHPYSFDVHSGNTDWEIWIGVLPLYKGDPAATAEAMNRYFAKNHAYRSGQSQLPKVFREISEHYTANTPADFDLYNTLMRTGQYAWTPWSAESSARIYFNSPATGMTAWDGYNDMTTTTADFTVTETHGYYAASGLINISWVESHPVHTTYFWSDGCAIGNLDYADNFLSSILYSPTSDVLVAKGTTNDSGGMGSNSNGFYGHNIAVAMSKGKSFGDAILYHVNVPLLQPWAINTEFHFATPIILGDPTLIR